MRIHIELEVAPEEVPLATELLAVLRQLTDHVSLRTANGSRASPLPPLPAAAAAAPVAPPLPILPSSSSQGNGSSSAATAAPPTPVSSGGGAASSAATAVPAGGSGDVAMPFPAGTTPQQQIHALIANAEYVPLDSAEMLQHGRQLDGIIWNPAFGGAEAMFPEFISIWSTIALNPALPEEERSAVPFVMMLKGCSQATRDKFRDRIMRDLLKHLTVQRPVNANRSDYYVHAEAFAALVAIEIVPPEGAVQTMITLANNPSKRGAAVTMLGKTVELAAELIHTKVSEATQAKLRDTVNSITDPDLHYDVEYINGAMWGIVAEPAAAAAAAPRQLTLQPVHSVSEAHSLMIFAMALDIPHQQLITGGRDPYLRVWSLDGKPVQTVDLVAGDAGVHVSGMDFHPALGMLLCSCLNPSTRAVQMAAFTSSGQTAGIAPKGCLLRSDATALASVRALPDTSGFLTGETVVVNGATSAVINFWDVAAAHAGFQYLQPTQTFRGHAEIVTALRGIAGDGNTFVSGDKEGCMHLWDRRSPSLVGSFGTAGADGRQKAHAGMITTVDCQGTLVVSGSTDKTVALWDIRYTGTQAPLAVVPAENPVLKLVINASQSVAAVSVLNQLFLLDLANPSAPVLSAPVVAAWPDGRKRATYHDIRWNDSVLYAGGKDKMIDIYSL